MQSNAYFVEFSKELEDKETAQLQCYIKGSFAY